MITGALFPDHGRVTIYGLDASDSAAGTRRQLGYLPESAPIYPEMKVREYLDFRGRLFGLERGLRRKAIAYAMDRCWLTDVAGRRIGKLSKGYKQRTGLAAAILHNPRVLVLDEPTNGLDPTQIRETRQLIRELAKDRTMLISSHILPEVERLCDRVIIMAAGRVRADGSPAELVARTGATYLIDAKFNKEGDDERIMKMLLAVPYAADVSMRGARSAGLGSPWRQWILSAKPGAPDLREHIATSLAEAKVPVRELHAELDTLEQVFMRILDEADAVPDAGLASRERVTQP
jgi:ABC-2 type transport system ATP-binding protein